MEPHRAGYVGLVGRPNVGKSTLLNAVLGTKVAAVAPRPQTTRNRIAGILTREGYQAILVDTPGIHRPHSPLNEAMVRAALSVLAEVDVVCWLVDAQDAAARARKDESPLGPGDAFVAEQVEATGTPALVVVNKVDLVDKRWLLPVMAACQERLPEATVLPVSALKADGLEILLQELAARLPEGPAFFPADQLTEQSERFAVSEIIREKLVRHTRGELPYATAVEIEAFDESRREEERPLVHINARILVERKSQKGIVIGKGGAMLKRIGSEARVEIEDLLGSRVHLELFVAVEDRWTRNPRLLRELGYE